MSVIPFVLDGINKTIVESQQEYEKEGGLDGNVIFIQSLDRSQILNTESSNATYDLRVGAEYRDHRDSRKAEVPHNEPIILQPGAAIIIETEEFVQFPKSRFGHIVPKVRLLKKGLSNTASKIDPGYYGKLSITVFNLGKRAIPLTRGEPFCTLYVLDVQAGALTYNKGPQRIESEPITGTFSKARDFIEGNQSLLTVISLAISTLSLVVGIFVGVVQAWQMIKTQKADVKPPQKVEVTQPKNTNTK